MRFYITIKENLIKVIIDMNDEHLFQLEEFITQMLWENLPEELPTEEENEIFTKYQSGDKEYSTTYSLEEVLG